MVMGASPARSSAGPAISVGSGPSSIVEYDLEFRPQKVYVGFRRPTDITPLPDGSLLVADEGAQEVVAFDPSAGTIAYRHKFPSGVLRARPRPRGGLIVTSGDKVLLTDEALKVEREIPVKGVRAAMELPSGHILTVSNEDQGWVTEFRPDGSVLWRSSPRARRDPAGKWVLERAEQTFVSTSSLDVRGDGEIFASDFDAHSLRLLSRDHLVLRSWSVPGLRHFFDTRFGPTGELIAVAPEALSVWIEREGGQTRTWTSPGNGLPLCANLSARRTILVGFQWLPENERLNATRRPSAQRKSPPFSRTFPGAVLLGMSAALLVCAALRWRDTGRASAPRSLPRVPDVAAIHDRPPAPPFSSSGKRSRGGVRAAQIGGALVVLVLAVAVAWGTVLGSGEVASHKMLRFALACAVGAIALRALNAMLGTGATFSSFSPEQSDGPAESRDVRRLAVPVGLALSSLTVCLLGILFRPNHPGFAVGAWIAAQIFILTAAFDRPVSRTGRSRGRASALLLGLVLLIAVFTRFWEIGHYPDFTHWDQGNYGSAALEVLRGQWSPLFIMEPLNGSIPRPWVAVCAVLLGVFGKHYWVLRLTAAISGVGIVLGTYLLGSSLLNRRAGLAAAFLASVNHVLLLYSRQPYVIDPAAFFVLALYCATLGLRSGRRFPWCLAGVLSGWSLLTYWASSALVVVGAAIFAGFALFYPRWLWRHRAGLLWMFLGAVIVYLPMVPRMRAATNVETRLHEIAVVSTPGGSVQRDPAFWKNQLRQTFGTILQNGESSGWTVWTGKPVVFGPETVLFGIGLISLLLYRSRAPALVLLPWIAIGFFLGNGLFENPSFYHCLGAIPPILLVSGVTVDRLLALADPWKPRLRIAPVLSAFLLLALIGGLHLRALWAVVGRPSTRQANGPPALRADLRSIVPLYIRENPNLRYYLVRTSTELSCAEPSFIFFADDSDISDITGRLEEALPIPPTDPPREVAFIVLPGRATGTDFIRTVYPNARTVELESTILPKPVQILLVDADSVRRAFEAVTATRAAEPVTPRGPSLAAPETRRTTPLFSEWPVALWALRPSGR